MQTQCIHCRKIKDIVIWLLSPPAGQEKVSQVLKSYALLELLVENFKTIPI